MGILSCTILKVIVKLYLCSKTGLNHATVTTEFIPSTLRCFNHTALNDLTSEQICKLKVVISELFLKYVTSIHLYSPELLISIESR